MADWSEGYVADVGYTFGYFNELNPLRAHWALLNRGVGHSIALDADATFCELGFGQGLSTNLHAAAQPGQWWGTDFNPSQAAFAQELAVASGSGAKLFDEAFADFCNRSDLPDFDFIALHGIWSWISDDNRRVIADFVRRKLKVGGALYISYNCLPGWAPAMPIRQLLTEHATSQAAPGEGIVKRIEASLGFAEKLFALNPMYLRANPGMADRLGKIKEQDKHYLAHEYFNRDWLPMFFSTLTRWLDPAKVNFAAPAHFLDHIDGINLTPDQASLLKEIPDRQFQETIRDFCTNQQFRRDLWVKGPRLLRPLEQVEAFRKMRMVLVTPRKLVQLKVTGGLGEAELKLDLYNPVLDALADHQIKSFQQLEQALAPGVSFASLREVLTVLLGTGNVVLAQDEKAVQKCRPRTDKLNQKLMMKARMSGEIATLASPVTGGGLPVPRFHQLFLLARLQGAKTSQDMAASAWQALKLQSQKIVKEGKPLEAEEDNLNELRTQAQGFTDTGLPILKALGIAP